MNHSQDNKYAGDNNSDEEEECDLYDTYYDVHYNYANGSNNNMYCYAYKYPYAVNCSSVGRNTIVATPNRAHPGETISLTCGDGMELERISIQNIDGNDISYSGNSTSGYTFTTERPLRPRLPTTITRVPPSSATSTVPPSRI